MPERKTASSMLFAKVGSKNETGPGESGITHHIEHRTYLRKLLKEWMIDRRGLAVDRIGARESASTEKEYTEYYLNSVADRVEKALTLLSEVFINPDFSRGMGKIEDEVIVNEIKEYRDDFTSTVQEAFEGLIFGKTSMAKPILGTPHSVRSQTRKQMMEYMNKWYRGENIMIVVAGNIKGTRKLVDKCFSRFPPGPAPTFEEASGYGEPGNKVITKDTVMAHFVLGVPGVSISDEDYYTMRIIEVILGGHQVLDERTVQSSKIYKQVRSKNGLAYEISAASFSGVDTGYLVVGGAIQPGNLEKTLDLVRKIMFGLASTVTREELFIAKQVYKDYLITQLDVPEKAADLLGMPTLFLDRAVTPSEMFAKVDAINLKKVRDLAERILVPGEARLAVLGPYDKDLRRIPKNQI